MKYYFKLVFYFSFIFLIGCGGSNVRTTKTTNKDLSNYNSFAYLPNTSPEVEGRNYNDEQVNTAIIETINSNMREAGYTVNRDNPDLLVLVSTAVDTQTRSRTQPVYAGYPYTSGVTTVSPFYSPYYYRGFASYNRVVGYDTDTYQYQEGTLVINFVDRETRETVWKGIASDNIYTQGNTAAIQEMVDDIFEQYPLNE
ncbi:DUF4136 domain-containing protein [Antarcticibacterium flavum]|uniref:DUF4136 domain-containing protein n=1 Tax=Antarcticibacterium flavum TaxID=2058175 RepID=A0A5B7X1P0_9FLAO|nr:MULTISPECIES: DUF4136 domain-containing protein [Antarcticibacterium]MCM4158678.1 hypothetical protein [Antarcticibacterium sp. W02-3]QCY68531.1 DUF4136 domain-containing protein [Antarcticibacterium flavum]